MYIANCCYADNASSLLFYYIDPCSSFIHTVMYVFNNGVTAVMFFHWSAFDGVHVMHYYTDSVLRLSIVVFLYMSMHAMLLLLGAEQPKAAERRVLFWLCKGRLTDRPTDRLTDVESPCNSDINCCFETL